MPGGDRTGPLGAGPRTGRGAGFCAGYETAGFDNPVGGRGFGVGRGRFGGGRGRGYRYWYQATGLPGWSRYGSMRMEQPLPVSGSEQQSLQAAVRALQGQLDVLSRRLDALNLEEKDV